MTTNAAARRHHARLTTIFGRALELSDQERDAFLADLERKEPALHRELKALLGSHTRSRSGGLLNAPLVGESAIQTNEGEDQSSSFPEHIGCYRLIERIASGGMGSVWLAEQERPVERRVALKLIRRSMTGDLARAHFQYERQLLARMEHPAIARLLDAGSLPDGRPWFAMELVAGEAIDVWCSRNALDLPTRLQLFLDVCGAVEHAHRRGIVHLDIKASNILVREVDGRVEVKLIDFGIALALGGGLLTESTAKSAGQWGSAASMSPEQARGIEDEVDVRSDVYSLGLLLHCLLTGHKESETGEFDGMTFEQVAAHLRTRERRTPSALFASHHPTDSAGSPSGISRSALLKILRRDLDWVVERATELDPDRRYPTVDALAQDLRRFQKNQPLSAAPGTLGYRLRKAYVRQRYAVLALTVVAFGLIGGTAIATYGLIVARRDRDAAELARLREAGARIAMEAEAERAMNMTAFLVETLRLADPRVTLENDMTLRGLLDVTALRLEGALDPRSEATLRATIGDALRSLGEDALARQHLTRAVQLLQTDRAHSPLKLYSAAWSLFLLHEKSDGRRSVELLLPVVHLRTELLESFDQQLTTRISPLLDARNEEQFQAALLDLPLALSAAERRHPADHVFWPVIADDLADLGLVLAREGGDPRALALLDEAERLLQERLPAGHPDLARLTILRAMLWLDDGEHALAAERLQAALVVLEHALPAEHWRLAQANSLLGECLFVAGERQRGLRMLESSAHILECSLGPFAAPTIEANMRLCDAQARGQDAASAELSRTQLAQRLSTRPFGATWWRLRASLLGPPRSELRVALHNLLRRCGPMAVSDSADVDLSELRSVLALSESAPEASQLLLGRVLLETARNLSPERLKLRWCMARAALDLLLLAPDALALQVADARQLLAEEQLSLGLPSAALELLAQVLPVLKSQLGPDSASTVGAELLRDRCLSQQAQGNGGHPTPSLKYDWKRVRFVR